MKAAITLATVPQERRVEVVDGRITFFFFWISAGDEPIVFINPNITKWVSDLKDGVVHESGGVTHNGDMRSVQFSDASPVHTVTLDDGEQLRITLQNKRKPGQYDMEIDLLIESL